MFAISRQVWWGHGNDLSKLRELFAVDHDDDEHQVPRETTYRVHLMSKNRSRLKKKIQVRTQWDTGNETMGHRGRDNGIMGMRHWNNGAGKVRGHTKDNGYIQFIDNGIFCAIRPSYLCDVPLMRFSASSGVNKFFLFFIFYFVDTLLSIARLLTWLTCSLMCHLIT